MVALVLFILVSILPSGDSRRRVASEAVLQNRFSVRPRDFRFRHKLNSTCQFWKEELSHRNIDVHNVMDSINDTLSQIEEQLSGTNCGEMTLASLPPTPSNSSDVLSLHLSIISTFSHLFVMKMDWLQARGLLCVGGLKLWTVSSLQKRLTDLWGELLCMFMNSITLETESHHLLTQNLLTTLSTPILRYPSCGQRTVRDCILRSQARNLLNILQQRLPFDSNRCVIA